MRIGVVTGLGIANHHRFGGKMVLGVNARGAACLATLEGIADLADEYKLKTLVVIGSLYGHSRLEPGLLIATRERMLAIEDICSIRWCDGCALVVDPDGRTEAMSIESVPKGGFGNSLVVVDAEMSTHDDVPWCLPKGVVSSDWLRERGCLAFRGAPGGLECAYGVPKASPTTFGEPLGSMLIWEPRASASRRCSYKEIRKGPRFTTTVSPEGHTERAAHQFFRYLGSDPVAPSPWLECAVDTHAHDAAVERLVKVTRTTCDREELLKKAGAYVYKLDESGWTDAVQDAVVEKVEALLGKHVQARAARPLAVTRLGLDGFTTHKEQSFFFGPGVTVINGKNGRGKSSVIEGVGWAAWGKTLRGKPPYPEGGGCKGLLSLADGLLVERVREGTTTDAKWMLNGAVASGAVVEELGSFETWSKSRVLSSRDSATFAELTDKDRKAIIEQYLGLGCFDLALGEAKEEAKALAVRTLRAERVLAQAQEVLGAEEARVAALSESVVAQAAADKSVAELLALEEGFALDEEDARGSVQFLAKKLAGVEVQLAAAKDRIEKLRGGTCPTCTQVVHEGVLHVHEVEAKELASRQAVFAKQSAAAATDLEELQTLRRSVAKRLAAERVREGLAQEAAQRGVRLAEAQQNAAAAKLKVAELQGELRKLRDEEQVIEGAVKVFGLRGMRAKLLQPMLEALAGVANCWLLRFGIQVKLDAFRDKKKGGEDERIQIAVTGAGGGHGYKAASAGERRRIDVALALALGEVDEGTLFFDEVFDCLDEEATEVVAGILSEVGKRRQIVVTTVSEQLAALVEGVRIDLGDA